MKKGAMWNKGIRLPSDWHQRHPRALRLSGTAAPAEVTHGLQSQQAHIGVCEKSNVPGEAWMGIGEYGGPGDHALFLRHRGSRRGRARTKKENPIAECSQGGRLF